MRPEYYVMQRTRGPLGLEHSEVERGQNKLRLASPFSHLASSKPLHTGNREIFSKLKYDDFTPFWRLCVPCKSNSLAQCSRTFIIGVTLLSSTPSPPFHVPLLLLGLPSPMFLPSRKTVIHPPCLGLTISSSVLFPKLLSTSGSLAI